MASTVTNLTQYFIEGATEALVYRLSNLDKFTYIVNKDGCYVNDYVRVPFISASAQAVSTFSHTAGYPASDSYVAGTSVQMTDWLARPYDVTDTDFTHVTPEVMTKLASTNANLLANDIEKKLFTYASASLTNNSASAAQWATNAAIVALSTTASAARWRDDEKFWVTSGELYWKCASNTDTLVANAYGNPSVVQNGVLTKYYGWNSVIADGIPSTVKGFAFTKDSLVLAASLPTPQSPNQLVALKTIKLPNGLNIQLSALRNEALRKTTFVAELITGYGVLRGGYNLLVNGL